MTTRLSEEEKERDYHEKESKAKLTELDHLRFASRTPCHPTGLKLDWRSHLRAASSRHGVRLYHFYAPFVAQGRHSPQF